MFGRGLDTFKQSEISSGSTDYFSANHSSPQTWCCSAGPWPHAELPPLQRQGYQSFKLMRHGLTLEVDGVVVNVQEPLGDDADGEQILIQNLVDELLQLGLSLDNEVTIYNKYIKSVVKDVVMDLNVSVTHVAHHLLLGQVELQLAPRLAQAGVKEDEVGEPLGDRPQLGGLAQEAVLSPALQTVLLNIASVTS